MNARLIPRLVRMRPRSRVVSHDFDIEGVEPSRHLEVKVDDVGHDVYLFEIPLQKAR